MKGMGEERRGSGTVARDIFDTRMLSPQPSPVVRGLTGQGLEHIVCIVSHVQSGIEIREMADNETGKNFDTHCGGGGGKKDDPFDVLDGENEWDPIIPKWEYAQRNCWHMHWD